MKSKLPQHIIDQAVEWAVKLGAGQANLSTQKAFEAWRRQDQRHEAAWQAVGHIDREFEKIPESMAELAGQTLEQTQEQMQKFKARRYGIKALVLAVLVIGIGYGAVRYHTFLSSKPVLYQAHTTLKGRRQTVSLPDDSRIILNTATRVEVDYSAQKREIHLQSGEIFIETGKDRKGMGPKRPFWVESKDARFQAVGTGFNVRILKNGTRLYVSEGRVDIHLKHASGGAVPVKAGQTFLVKKDAGQMPVELKHPELEPACWVKGTLAVRQMPLDKFAVELSRYIPGRIDTDPCAAGLAISGVFQIKQGKDAAKIIDALSQTLPVEVKKEGDHRYTIYLRPG